MKIFIYLICILTGLSQATEARESPTKKEVSEISEIIDTILTRDEFTEAWMRDEIRGRLTNRQIGCMAMICKVLDYSDTSQPPGSIEDANRLYHAFLICVKTLNDAKAIPELRKIYGTVNIQDGAMRDWIEILGKDWRRSLKLSDLNE